MILKKILNSINKIINIEKLNFITFLFLSIIITFLELFNIYVISSFINFIIVEENNNNKTWIFEYLNIDNFQTAALFTICTIIIRCVGSYMIKSYEFFYVYRVLAKVTNNYFRNILNLDYKKILEFKFSRLTNTMMHEIVNFVLCIFQPSIIILLEVLISLTLIIYTFIFIDFLFIFLACIFAILYFVFFLITNPFNTSLGKRRLFLEQRRFNLINDNIRGIRHLKFSNSNYLVDLLSNTLFNYGDITAKKKILVISSKYLLELIAYIALISLLIISYNMSVNFLTDVITLVAISFRLVPSFNRIISEAFVIKFNLPVLEKAIDLNFIKKQNTNKIIIGKLKNDFTNQIRLSNITFKYNLSKKHIFKNYSLKISKNKITGITGKSGVGKTTLVNIISGLLRIDYGKFLIDNDEINDKKKLFSWSKNVSLFSQDSFIFNGSIKENILFGEALDLKRLNKICNELNIFEFINKKNLSRFIDPYKNNLSSGQIQRILLARALYKKSMIYIFDEPTTNLDKKNKDKFMNYLKNYKNTYLIVTHDKELLKNVDRLVKIK